MAPIRIFVPTRVTPAGPRHLAVRRSGRSRVVAFENFDMAQRAVDVVSGGDDLIHVVAGLLTCPLTAGEASEGPMIVHELDADAITAFLGIDVCEFHEPNFVDVIDAVDVADAADASETDRARLDGLYDSS
jgi:hypothetical protein